mmetsp:Transcript_16943/g.36546  ORF Transcript_16943/g.36546 Transcript_16943/m.36546 type:complete len:107 (-) Transcript_16943:1275-1595(-)
MTQFRQESISNPISPAGGHTCGRLDAGERVARTGNSHSPQNIVCGTSIPRTITPSAPTRTLGTANMFSSSSSPKKRKKPIKRQWKCAHRKAVPAPSNPMQAPKMIM